MEELNFAVAHMFTHNFRGVKAGDIEYPEVRKTDDGLHFTVYSLSPIMLGWSDVLREPDEPDTPTTDTPTTDTPTTDTPTTDTPTTDTPTTDTPMTDTPTTDTPTTNTPTTEIPTTSETPDTATAQTAVKTGDDENIFLAFLLFFLSSGGMIYIYRRKRER